MPFIAGALFFNTLAAAVAVPSAVGLFKLMKNGLAVTGCFGSFFARCWPWFFLP